MYAREPLAEIPDLREQTQVTVDSRRYGRVETHIDLDQLSTETDAPHAVGEQARRTLRERHRLLRNARLRDVQQAELETFSRTPQRGGEIVPYRVTAALGRGDVFWKGGLSYQRRRNRGPRGFLNLLARMRVVESHPLKIKVIKGVVSVGTLVSGVACGETYKIHKRGGYPSEWTKPIFKYLRTEGPVSKEPH